MIHALLLLTLPAVIHACAYEGDVYDYYSGRCYHISNNLELSFDAAKTYCANLGYTMASIHSREQNNFFKDNTSPSEFCGLVLDGCTIRVGGHRDQDTGNFIWTDGSNFDYTNWNLGEPVYDTLVINTTNGEWATVSEYDSLFNVICEAPMGQTETATVPATTDCYGWMCGNAASGPTTAASYPNPSNQPSSCSTCPSGWTYYDLQNSCYSTLLASNWNSAEFLCKEVGGHLTSIHNYGENAFVASLSQTGLSATSPEQQTWIGLNYESGFWQWSDGSRVDFINWAPREPVDTSTKQCVTISQDSSEQSWQTVECDTRMRMFVCKKPTNNMYSK